MRPEVRDTITSAQREVLALTPPYADHCVLCHRTAVGDNWLVRRVVNQLVVVESLESPGVFGAFDLFQVDVESYVDCAVRVMADLYPGAGI